MNKAIGLIILFTIILSVGMASAETIEVSQPTYGTSNNAYDRNPSIVQYGDDYWMFYAKGDDISTNGVRGTGYDPDADEYVIWYKTASSFEDLAAASETKLALSETNRPANFDQRVVSAAVFDGNIYAFVSSGQSGADRGLYYYEYSGGSWSGPTTLIADGTARGGHVNVAVNSTHIYIVWESTADASSDCYTWDGTTLSSKIDISDGNQPKIAYYEQNKSGNLFVVNIEDGTGDIEIFLAIASPNPLFSHHSTAIPGGGFYDPCIFTDGTDLYVISAPYVSIDDHQYLIQTKFDNFTSTWSNTKTVSFGGYGSTCWWDYWPCGYHDGTDAYVFFTTETNSPVYGDGEIAFIKMDWELDNNHYFYIQNAVNQASTGDTAAIEDGLYTESNITIDKSLTVIGKTRDGVIVAPLAEDIGSGTSSFDGTYQYGFMAIADNVTIKDITIDGSANNLANGGTLPDHNNYRVGIANYADGNDGYNNLTVENVNVKYVRQHGIALGYYGGSLNGGHSVTACNIDHVDNRRGICSYDAPVVISGNDISYTGMGIYVSPSPLLPEGSGETITITNNTLTYIAGMYSLYYGHNWPCVGIYYRNPNYDQELICTGNDLTIGDGDEETDMVGVTGMYIYNADNNSIIDDNTIDATSGTENWGIYLGGCAGTIVSNNDFIMNEKDCGIYLGRGNPDPLLVVPNIVSGNTFISSLSSSSSITEGTAIIQGNHGDLFWMVEDPQNTDNTITGNVIDGFVRGILLHDDGIAAYSVNAAINNNSIINNNVYGVDASTLVNTIDASGNWWGTTVPAEVAGKISSHVDFTPWLGGGTDTDPGFQGDFSELWVDDDSPQTGTTERIQEGVNLVDGSTVNIAAGTYVETIDISRDLSLIGESEASVLIDASSFSDYGVYAIGDYTVALESFTVEGPPSQTYGYGVKISGDNASISINDVTVQNSGRSGFDLNGVVFGDLQNLTATGNGGVGLGLSDCDNVTINNMTSSGNAWGGIGIFTYGHFYTGGSDNITLTETNNLADYLYTQIDNYNDPLNPYPITNLDIPISLFGYIVSSNLAFTYIGYFPDLATAIGAAAGGPDPTNSYVIERVSGEFYVGPGMTIQAAIDAASDGDIINVLAGTYAEALNIPTNNLSIIGAGRSLVAIDAGGLSGFNNSGIYVAGNAVTLQGFTFTGEPSTAAPRYGIKYGSVVGGALTDILVTEFYRTGVDMLGSDGLVISNFESADNGGNGIQICDGRNISFNNITTSGNAWGGIGIFTYGRYAPMGVENIVFTGTNSLGETSTDNGGLYLEEGNYSDPANPEPITFSIDPLDNADVTIQLSDFVYFMKGDSDNDNIYTRFYTSLSDILSALAGSPGHITTNRTMQNLMFPHNFYVYDIANGLMTIQAAVDASVPDDTINVMTGNYEEQVVIGKNLIVTGEGKDATIIESPTTLTEYFTTSAANYPIVYIHDADVDFENMTIDGLGRGNTNYRFVGIGFWNAGGSVNNVRLTGVRDEPFSGAQHGVSIYSYNDTDGPYTISVSDVDVDDMQKTGIALLGNGLTVDIDNVTTIGNGPTDVTAQNGIEVGYGAGGTIDDCTITGITYTGATWTASGLLLLESSVPIISTNVNIDQCQTSVYFSNANGTFDSGTITNPHGDALYAFSLGALRSDVKIPKANPQPIDKFASVVNDRSPVDVTVSNSIITGADAIDSWGPAGYAIGPVAFTVTNCEVSHWDWGVVVYDDGGGITSNVSYCKLYDNLSYGLYTNDADILDAEHNWWGTLNCPVITASISGDVDFEPYCNSDFSDCSFTCEVSIVWVDDDWAGSSDGQDIGGGKYFKYNAFDIIMDGITAVSEHGTVNVAAGIYHNDITAGYWDGGNWVYTNRIDKSISVLGAQADVDPAGSTDERSGGESILTRDEGLPYSIVAPNVVVNGFMNGSNSPNTGGRFIIGDDADNVIIKYCIIQNTPNTSSGHGICVYPGAENTIISYNTIANTAWEGIRNDGNAEISYNTIRDIVANKGIMFGENSSGSIGNNTIFNTFYEGIAAFANASITGNDISGCYHGIQIRGDATNYTIDGNNIHNNQNHGIEIPNYSGEIVAGATITNNTIADNPYCGVKVGGNTDGSGYYISNNTFIGNGIYGVESFTTADVNAEHNWWGAYCGPYHSTVNPLGEGDGVSDNVDFDPWCNDDFTDCTFSLSDPPAVVWVDDDYTVTGYNDGHLWCYDAFASIHNAAKAVADNGTVHVADGTYREQVTIESKSLDLLGAGIGISIVEAVDVVDRSTYVITQWSGSAKTIDACIGVLDAGTVNISGFTVDGRDLGPNNFYGIHYFNTDGAVTGCRIEDITYTGSPSSSQIVSLAATHGDGQSAAIEFSDIKIPNFQKCGILTMGPGIAFTINNNTVEGQINPNLAPNGIQVSYGSFGSLSGNEVSMVGYPGDDWAGTGILLFESGDVTVTGGIVIGCESGINHSQWNWIYTPSATPTVIVDGVDMDDNQWSVSTHIANDGVNLNFEVKNCVIDNSLYTGINLWGSDEDPWGGSYYSGWTNGTLNVDIHDNHITNSNGDAIDEFIELPTGNVVNCTAIRNNYSGYADYGVYNNFTNMIDATQCYWGMPAGPTTFRNNGRQKIVKMLSIPFAPDESEMPADISVVLKRPDEGSVILDGVTSNVDYSPWWGGNYVDDNHASFWSWWVDNSNSSTIQEGIDFTLEGDTVFVTPNEYTGIGNKEIDFGGKDIVLKASEEIDNTIINCESSGRAFHFHNGETEEAKVIGFTIKNGSVVGSGGAFLFEGSSSPIITSCLIVNNQASSGGACYVYDSQPTFINNTISKNAAVGGFYSNGGGFYNNNSSPIITNSIFWDNTATGSGDQIYNGTPEITYCDIEGGYIGATNIDINPLFRDPTNGDFHLMSIACGDAFDSPCIDMGYPNIKDAIADCNHGLGTDRSDIGAYGGVVILSGYEYLPGDANMYNGLWPPIVIGGDVTYLVNYFKGYETSLPCLLNDFWCSADANGDCQVIGSDVIRLVNYFRGLGDIQYCPEYLPLWLTPDDIPAEAPDGWPNCEIPTMNNKTIPSNSIR
ncbi:MAG: right-handed parallel beta-helix repeat-containing protein [candidate division Zixibacteria bacterium]|nr:right-handed parallel beta-helix repeat-containing protein [candidate division Zixibacteria bacterium]